MTDNALQPGHHRDSLGKAVLGTHGIVCTPHSHEHPNGWGAPFKDVDGNPINGPLGTAFAGSEADFLTDPRDKNKVRLSGGAGSAHVKARGVNPSTGNTLSQTKIGNTWWMVSFFGPPSGWAWDSRRDLYQVTYALEARREQAVVFVKGKAMTTPSPVLTARIVRKTLADASQAIRLYILCSDGKVAYANAADFGTPSPEWHVIATLGLLDKANLSGAEFDPEPAHVPSERSGAHAYRCWSVYSAPRINNDGTEIALVIASQGVLDSGIAHVTGYMAQWTELEHIIYQGSFQEHHGNAAHYDDHLQCPVQKYLGVAAIDPSDAVSYSVSRWDADNGTTSDYLPERATYGHTFVRSVQVGWEAPFTMSVGFYAEDDPRHYVQVSTYNFRWYPGVVNWYHVRWPEDRTHMKANDLEYAWYDSANVRRTCVRVVDTVSNYEWKGGDWALDVGFSNIDGGWDQSFTPVGSVANGTTTMGTYAFPISTGPDPDRWNSSGTDSELAILAEYMATRQSRLFGLYPWDSSALRLDSASLDVMTSLKPTPDIAIALTDSHWNMSDFESGHGHANFKYVVNEPADYYLQEQYGPVYYYIREKYRNLLYVNHEAGVAAWAYVEYDPVTRAWVEPPWLEVLVFDPATPLQHRFIDAPTSRHQSMAYANVPLYRVDRVTNRDECPIAGARDPHKGLVLFSSRLRSEWAVDRNEISGDWAVAPPSAPPYIADYTPLGALIRYRTAPEAFSYCNGGIPGTITGTAAGASSDTLLAYFPLNSL